MSEMPEIDSELTKIEMVWKVNVLSSKIWREKSEFDVDKNTKTDNTDITPQ